jgi:hypothetical protein
VSSSLILSQNASFYRVFRAISWNRSTKLNQGIHGSQGGDGPFRFSLMTRLRNRPQDCRNVPVPFRPHRHRDLSRGYVALATICHGGDFVGSLCQRSDRNHVQRHAFQSQCCLLRCPGGLGGSVFEGIRDTRMIERAFRERWPLSEETRKQLLERQVEIALSKEVSPREATSAFRSVLSADKMNMAEEKRASPQPQGAGIAIQINNGVAIGETPGAGRSRASQILERVRLARISVTGSSTLP